MDLQISDAKQALPVKQYRAAAEKKDDREVRIGYQQAAIKHFIEAKTWIRGPKGTLFKQSGDGLWVQSGGVQELSGLIMSKFHLKSSTAYEAAAILAADKLPEASIIATVPHKQPGLIKLNGVTILNLRPPLPEWEEPTEELNPLLDYLKASMGGGYDYFMSAMHRYAHQKDGQGLLPSQAIVLVGDYGAGKTLICRELLSAILGQPADMNENALASQFTGSLFAAPYVVADDALTGHKIKPAAVAAKLKEITGLCEQRVEQKGRDAVQLPWSGPLIITANLGETSALPDWRPPAGEAPRLVAIYMRKPEGGPEALAPDGGNVIDYITKVRAQFAQYVYNYKVPAELRHERYITRGYVADEIACEFNERPDPAAKIRKEIEGGCLSGIVNLSAGDIYDLLKAHDLTHRDKVPIVDKYLSQRKLAEILTTISSDCGSKLIKTFAHNMRRYSTKKEEKHDNNLPF